MNPDHRSPDNDLPSADGDPSASAAQPSPAEPAPPGPGDAPLERRSRGLWLYFAGIFLLGTCTGQPAGADTPEMLGELVGGGLGMLLISIVLVSVFLGWRQSTRARIPGAAFIAALVLVPILRSEDARETQDQFAALQSFADSTSGPVDTADAPPRNDDARMLWATRKAMEDVTNHTHAVARAQGIDPDHPPEAWLSAAYVADARGHPEVHRYFTRYRSYVRRVDTTIVPLLTERLRVRLRESGVPASQVDAFMRGVDKGIEESADRRGLATERELANQALKLHAYLVAVDARVHLGSGTETASFEVEAERLQVADLVESIERLGSEAEAHERRARDRMREIGRAFGIDGDSATRDAGDPGTTAAGRRRT